MRNRYGDQYWFEPVNENTYVICGDLRNWRFGAREVSIDMNDLGFADPSGGPFMACDHYQIEGRVVRRIRVVDEDIHFEVE